MRKKKLLVLLAGGVMALAVVVQAVAQVLPSTTTWMGNTFGGGPGGKWVQNFIFTMAVNSEGRCFTASHWDEAHRESGIYQDGDVIGNCKGAVGEAVAVNGTHVFVGDKVGAKQFRFDGTATGVVYPMKHNPRYLAASASILVSSDAVDGTVNVYDIGSTTPIKSFEVNKPGALAVGTAGDIWVISNIDRQAWDGRYWVIDPAKPAQILHFAKDGQQLPQTIADTPDWKPTCLALDNQGRLMVGDDGPRQQVLLFDISGDPKLVGTFGAMGGIGSGTPGEVRPDKFWCITGVGTDKAGNIYVSCSQQGCFIRSFKPDGSLRWELMNQIFVDVADFDPAAPGLDIFTKQEHYVFDYSQAPGRGWKLKGYSLDAVKYPQDPRLWMANDGHSIVSPFMRRLNGGRLYMYLIGMSSENLNIYRFDGEIAIPAGLMLKKHYASRGCPGYPPNQPEKGEWLWRDANGDGQFQPEEFVQPQSSASLSEHWAWWVDDKGDIWTDGQRDMRHFPLQGFDAHGNPIYSYESMKVIPFPQPFTKVSRIEYHPDTDVMYLSGYTAEQPYNGKFWKEAGRLLARYDNWSKGEPKPKWQIKWYWNEGDRSVFATPHSFYTAGDYIFVGYFHRGGPVIDRIYRAADGQFVGEIKPGPEVGSVLGDIDVVSGIRAMKRPDGEYIILQEDDRYGKIVMFRWKPEGGKP